MRFPRIRMGTFEGKPVYWPADLRSRHLGIVAKSGAGKTVAMENYVYQDSIYPNSIVFLDPSGQTALNIYSILKRRKRPVRMCGIEYSMSLNVMKLAKIYPPSVVANIIIEAIAQLMWVVSRMLMSVPQANLIYRAVCECIERKRYSLVNVRDRILGMKGVMAPVREAVLSRLNFLINDPRMHEILCGHNSVDWGKFIDRGERLILDSFGMSADQMVFVGSLILQQIKAYFRYERREKYRPISIYIDEAHNYLNANIIDLLKEGRKYNISAIFATQDTIVIDDKIAALMLNVGNLIGFQCGHREARLLAAEMNIAHTELMKIEKYHFQCLLGNEQIGPVKATRPLTIRKIKPQKVKPQRVKRKGWFQLVPVGSH